jgi:transposase
MARERRLLSEEFRREAVKLKGQPGTSKAAIARDFGIGVNLLERWCRDSDVDAQGADVPEKISPKNMSACGANWQKSRRSTTY